MYSLIYTSVATTVMQPAKLIEILKYSRDWNKDHDITGCLAYIEGQIDNAHQCRFIQVLEGPEQEVISLFKNIKRDTRHGSITLIKQGKIKNRNFDSWEMGFEKMILDDNPVLQSFFKLDPQVLAAHGDIQNNMLMEFMKTFYNYL